MRVSQGIEGIMRVSQGKGIMRVSQGIEGIMRVVPGY